jgi:aerobic C4-dicarboxylate transport protein
VPFLLGIVPRTLVDAFASGDVLQVLLISILTGFAVAQLGALGERITRGIRLATRVVFGIIRIITKLAPLGALGGMAFTIGSYGVGSLPDEFYFRRAHFGHHCPSGRLLNFSVSCLHKG